MLVFGSVLIDSCNLIGAQGELLLNPATRTADVVFEEYAAAKGEFWASKDMLQVIQRKAAQPRDDVAPGSCAAAHRTRLTGVKTRTYQLQSVEY